METNEKTVLLDAHGPEDRQIDRNRRKLAGLGASAIFTLASRPVLAAECNSPSAHASGNVSFRGDPTECNGDTTAEYQKLFQEKESTETFATTTESTASTTSSSSKSSSTSDPDFHHVFKTGMNADWGNKKFSQVLKSKDNGNTSEEPNPISKEFVAALLNIRRGLIPESVLSEVRLMGMWNEWVDGGIYNPQAGMEWNSQQIVSYLQSLQA